MVRAVLGMGEGLTGGAAGEGKKSVTSEEVSRLHVCFQSTSYGVSSPPYHFVICVLAIFSLED